MSKPPKIVIRANLPALATKRLTKVAVKQEAKAREERRGFIVKVLDTHGTEATAQRATVLVDRACQAKTASFLGQYRRVR